MNEKVSDLLVMLEDDLASMYEKLSHITHFKEVKPVFELMVTQSKSHSQRIENIFDELKKPVIREEEVYDLHIRIKNHIYDEVIAENDTGKCIDQLASGEEKIGNMYKDISTFFKDLSNYYYQIGKKIEEISDEEYRHRDVLLRHKNNPSQKKGE
jgi:hypothetical protein